MGIKIDQSTPIFQLTVGDFLSLINSIKNEKSLKDSFPKVYGVEVLHKKTGYSINTIYSKTSKNEIPHTKRDGKLFFIDEEIDAWLTENRIETKAEYSRRMDRKLSKG